MRGYAFESVDLCVARKLSVRLLTQALDVTNHKPEHVASFYTASKEDLELDRDFEKLIICFSMMPGVWQVTLDGKAQAA